MYTFLIGEDNTLTATVVERIMERSKLVDSLHFLAEPTYKDVDMSDFVVMLEYVLPISKKYKTEILELSDERYKDMLEYKLPFDTALTSEPGDIEIQLTFAKVELSADDQRILATQAMIKALNEQNNTIMKSKADSLRYKDSILQLTAQGNPIGAAVKIESGSGGGTDPDDGSLRVVEF